jgi:hypothetical protein
MESSFLALRLLCSPDWSSPVRRKDRAGSPPALRRVEAIDALSVGARDRTGDAKW